MGAGSKLEREIDLAYGKAFGVGPMPETSREWFGLGFRAALAAPAPAQAGGGDACCLFCRTGLDPDEMDDGSDLPPLAPGVCSECFQRWHDEPVWRKRLKDATDKPAQAGEALPASLLPVARALLRDADTALGNTGGMRGGLPKATVDASRLRHVVAAVVAHLDAQRPGGAAQEPPRASSPSSGYCASDVCPTCGERSCPTGTHLPRAKPAEGGEGGA